jgi:hypothetical protein
MRPDALSFQAVTNRLNPEAFRLKGFCRLWQRG